MSVLSAPVSAQPATAVTKETTRLSVTQVTDGHELPRGYWESHLDHLEQQPVLLTTELSLQLPVNIVSKGRRKDL